MSYITQSAVSRCLRMNRCALIEVEKLLDIDEKLRKPAETIMKKNSNEYYIHGALVKISILRCLEKVVCSFHSKSYLKLIQSSAESADS
ncbi:hypothetical protein A3L08_04720 [Thermococcus pacificus]|uniref:Uncharacterized protein n=1 Tax=Thermococcus pacificus TaxID=71998 RepID=A0A218P7C1_9EURY|nr:hypothetical protein A3L08_04720 [Thermococcus pacificus]